MNTDTFIPDQIHYMPIDRLVFATDLPVQADLVADPAIFLDSNKISCADITEKPANLGKNSPRQLWLSITGNASIRLRIEEVRSGDWRLRKVEFNPGKLLHYHNGRVLDVEEAVTAFGLLCQAVEPLLADGEDIARLLPGCHANSPSFWKEIEIPLHLDDSGDRILAALKNIRHPRIRKKATEHEGESVTIGGKRSKLKIIAYRKDLEMARDIDRFYPDAHFPVVRLEVTLRGDLLMERLGSSLNVATIRKTPRLVRFSGEDLIRAHKAIVRELKGVVGVQTADVLPTDEKVGRFMALVAHRTNEAIEAWLDIYKRRFDPSGNTLSRLRKAALAEMELIPPDVPDLFSDDSYTFQPHVLLPRIEWNRADPLVRPDLVALIMKHYGAQG